MSTHLRHAPRHVHHTVAGRIQAGLDELRWTHADASQRPFGADQVKVRRVSPVVDARQSDIFAGLCAITIGDEYRPEEQELGGPLSLQELPIFIDVLMGDEATALCLASDIRDICLGRLEGHRTVFPVVDQVTRQPAPGWLIRLEDVERVQPETPMPLRWQVVKVTAEVEFNEAVF